MTLPDSLMRWCRMSSRGWKISVRRFAQGLEMHTNSSAHRCFFLPSVLLQWPLSWITAPFESRQTTPCLSVWLPVSVLVFWELWTPTPESVTVTKYHMPVASQNRTDRSFADCRQAARKLKLRQLGTLRLLAELFNRDLLTPAIMKIVTAELLSRSKTKGAYDSELIECVVQARPPSLPCMTSPLYPVTCLVALLCIQIADNLCATQTRS